MAVRGARGRKLGDKSKGIKLGDGGEGSVVVRDDILFQTNENHYFLN